jgi:hypothetical protein
MSDIRKLIGGPADGQVIENFDPVVGDFVVGYGELTYLYEPAEDDAEHLFCSGWAFDGRHEVERFEQQFRPFYASLRHDAPAPRIVVKS